MNTRTRKRFVKRCAKVEWRKAFLPWHYNGPHEYLYRKRTCPKEHFDKIAAVMGKHAVPRRWRKHRYNFLFVDGLIYWRIDECINRTDRRALNNGGYPSKPDLARIRKRFWPTKTDRLRYKELYG
jgi:hypothetical protein